ncbi:MAG: hypothetical protein AAGA85_09515 [Bacteroidota bacterium]
MEATTENLISKALQEYERVREELNRPQEDLVMIAACELVKKSITDFLEAFLAESGVETFERGDLLQLQSACMTVDLRFADLDFSSIACLSEEDSYAYTNNLEDQRLTGYVNTLERVKDLVLEIAPVK